jgi:coenzyme F420-reducing hydrogenase gamma subunit
LPVLEPFRFYSQDISFISIPVSWFIWRLKVTSPAIYQQLKQTICAVSVITIEGSKCSSERRERVENGKLRCLVNLFPSLGTCANIGVQAHEMETEFSYLNKVYA